MGSYVRKAFAIFSVCIFLSIEALAQDAKWIRYPSISPNGESVAFCYQGNIFVVPSTGGRAVPLTLGESYEFKPIWSPDGRFIVYASDRNGSFDLYRVSAKGSSEERLTVHSGADIPVAIDPKGKKVFFKALRQDHVSSAQFPSRGLGELYSLELETRRISQPLTTPAEDVSISKDGSFMLYHDQKGYENSWRKHHTSSVTRDIWRYDMAKKEHKRLSDFSGEDRSPVLAPDEKSYYYLSEQGGSFNVWQAALTGETSPRAITSFEKNPVRFLSISASGTLCFMYDSQIYLMAPGQEAKPIALQLDYGQASDNRLSKEKRSGATEMALSPNGKEIAFIVRGEIFVTSIDHSQTKQITQTPFQERSVSFSPDGRSLLYAREDMDSWNLYQTKLAIEEEPFFYNSTSLKVEPILTNQQEVFQPSFSPNGKEVAFLENRTTLRVINLASGKVRTIMPGSASYSYADGDQWYEWSPDGKWFLVEFNDPNRWVSEAGIVSADGKGEITNLTLSGYSDSRPRWMMEGKMFIWQSDRHGMRSHGSWGSESDVYAGFFDEETFRRFNMSEAEYAAFKEFEKQAKGEREEGKKDKKDDDEKVLEPLKLDISGVKDRKKRLSLHSSSMGGAYVDKAGEKMYYLARFEDGHDLWVQDLKDRSTKVLCKMGSRAYGLTVDKDEKQAFVLSSGRIWKIGLKDGKKKSVAFRAELNVSLAEERDYLFEHVWRQVKRKFYDPKLHDVDWDYYRGYYKGFLPSINNNYDFAELLSEMLGELNASHTGSGHRHRQEGADQTASLGIIPDWDFQGNGVRIAEVLAKGPLDVEGSELFDGYVINSINGISIKGLQDYYSLLNKQKGKKVLVGMVNTKGKPQTLYAFPISQGAESRLLYKRWVDGRRKEVERLSNGRLGYVHVRSMDDASFRVVYEEVLGQNSGKEALVVDSRFNGGGWLHDDLVTLLSGKRYVDFVPRGQHIGSDPMEKWNKPSAVLVSEGNYSDAHAFPYVYKTLGIGKLIGMPVPGTMTAVWWETLQDPTLYFGIPQVGARALDGSFLENQQLEPDIKIWNKFEDMANGKDAQLEAAVDHLLDVLDKK